MARRKKAGLIVLSLLIVAVLSGCGYPELYERILIHGIGVDWDGEAYQVTVRSSISAEDEGEEIFQCEGKTVLEALSSLSLSTGREPFYSHNYLVVFGMNCARRGLDDCLDFFVRYYNTRPSVSMFLAEGSAQEILSAGKDGKLLKMSELQALGNGGQYNGEAVDVEILDFINGVKGEGMSPVLPVLRATDSGAETVATAFFHRYVIKGLLTPEETRGYLAGTGKLEKGEIVVGGDVEATLSIREAKGTTELDVRGEAPSYRILVELDADVSAVSSSMVGQEEFYAALEREAKELLEEEVRGAITRSVVENSCDIFGFGRQAYRENPPYWRRIGESWPQLMSTCVYDVEVAVKVRRLEQENMNGIH